MFNKDSIPNDNEFTAEYNYMMLIKTGQVTVLGKEE